MSRATRCASAPVATAEATFDGRETQRDSFVWLCSESTVCVHALDTPRFYQSFPGKQNRIAQRTGEFNAREREQTHSYAHTHTQRNTRAQERKCTPMMGAARFVASCLCTTSLCYTSPGSLLVLLLIRSLLVVRRMATRILRRCMNGKLFLFSNRCLACSIEIACWSLCHHRSRCRSLAHHLLCDETNGRRVQRTPHAHINWIGWLKPSPLLSASSSSAMTNKMLLLFIQKCKPRHACCLFGVYVCYQFVCRFFVYRSQRGRLARSSEAGPSKN